jgi:hypothetical protein
MQARTAIVVTGIGAVVFVAVMAAPLTLFVYWDCEGFESTPSSARHCDAPWPTWGALLVIAIAGPLYGLVAAAHQVRWKPLGVGCAAAFAAVLVLALAFRAG